MTDPNRTELPRLAPGTYLLTKRVIVNAEGLSEFVDEPVGEYIKGFWPHTRARVTPVLDEETPLRERVRRAVEQALIGAYMVDSDVEKITFGTADSRAVADEVLVIVGPELERLAAEARVVRDQLLAALPDEWNVDEPTLGSVADAVRSKLKARNADCLRVVEALLPILREHPLFNDVVQVDNPRAERVAKAAAEVLVWQRDQLAAAESSAKALQQLIVGNTQAIGDTRPNRRWWSLRKVLMVADVNYAVLEPELGGGVRVEASSWPGGHPHVWLSVEDYSSGASADVVLKPREVLRLCWQLIKAAATVGIQHRRLRS